MFNMSRSQIDAMIKPLDRLQSLDVYRQYPGALDKKNHSFTPILLPRQLQSNDRKGSPDPYLKP
jgi:hypothetical protein